MNKEDYVSLQVAKLLKEKGFKQKCEKYIVEDRDKSWQEWDDGLMCYKTFYDTIEYPKPTIYQAAKWLREKHNIHIRISTNYKGMYSYGCFEDFDDEFDMELKTLDLTEKEIYKYNSYEEALNAGILEALESIK